jgi:hypothetical protein
MMEVLQNDHKNRDTVEPVERVEPFLGICLKYV